jgi:hypothetical protein
MNLLTKISKRLLLKKWIRVELVVRKSGESFEYETLDVAYFPRKEFDIEEEMELLQGYGRNMVNNAIDFNPENTEGVVYHDFQIPNLFYRIARGKSAMKNLFYHLDEYKQDLKTDSTR